MEYFTNEKISDSIIRIRDITKTAIYLILGTKRACLIDTGTGIGDLREYVESLTDLPYDVILTHGHVDHASAAALFEDKAIYMHPLDRDLMKEHTEWSMRRVYAKHAKYCNEISDSELVPLYDSSKTIPLSDGQRFDLGNLSLEIIHTPGHTQGMCMVLIEEERKIIFGDGCGVNVMLLEQYATTVETYLTTLLKVKKYEDRYDRVLRNHGTCESEKDVLDNVTKCCDDVLNQCDDHMKASGLALDYDDAYYAKERDLNSRRRVDGKEGNLVYRLTKIRK